MNVANLLIILYVSILVVLGAVSIYGIFGKPYHAHLRKSMMGTHPLPSFKKDEQTNLEKNDQ